MAVLTGEQHDQEEGEEVGVGGEELDVHAAAVGEGLLHGLVEDGVDVGAVAASHAGRTCQAGRQR